MGCLICDGVTEPFLKKKFNGFGLGVVEYSRCRRCGFVLSETHREMSTVEWQSLNADYHAAYQGEVHNPDDPRWVSRLQAQAAAIYKAHAANLIPAGRWLDYACGDGKLSEYVADWVDTPLLCYDRFMGHSGYLDEGAIQAQSFDFVITTSVFEHLRTRAEFDAIHELLGEGGVMGLHTLVCENVPPDPGWFYFLPVHCAFHTNASMAELMRQWGFTSSIYHVSSRLWFLFSLPFERVARLFDAMPRGEGEGWYCRSGFVDYWK